MTPIAAAEYSVHVPYSVHHKVERQTVGWSGIKSAPSAAGISVVMLVTVGFLVVVVVVLVLVGGFSGLTLGAFCLEGDLFSALLLPWAFQRRFQYGVAGCSSPATQACQQHRLGRAWQVAPTWTLQTLSESRPVACNREAECGELAVPLFLLHVFTSTHLLHLHASVGKDGNSTGGQMARKGKKIRESTRHLAILPHSLQLADTQSTALARCYAAAATKYRN